MARLTDLQKAHVVTALAAFHSPAEVRDELNEIFGIEAKLDHIMYYDPGTANGAKLAEKWRALFHETRERTQREVETIPIANKAFRLRRLQKIFDATKSPRLQMECLERAAKEVGDAYTNTHRHRLTGKDDETPIRTESAVIITMPDNGRGDRALGAFAPSGDAVDRPGLPGLTPSAN